ncbi:hypothetical protein EGP98_05605 [bacterium]|nr:hypothetical protein [bacterium]
MTILQAERFYEQDSKKYEVLKNKELLSWLKNSIENGYHHFIDIEGLQNLVDDITNWYEIKYPEREMEFYEGIGYFDFENVKSLSKLMNIKQLMYRLPREQLYLMECNYRSTGGCIKNIYDDNNEVIGQKAILFMSIYRKNVESSIVPNFLLYADTDSGKVEIDYNLKDYVNADSITLDELLNLFKEKYSEEFSFTELEKCVYNHNCDVELRNKVLQLVALKLLYSRRTIPERGYEIAKRFINEFNKKMNLNISTEEIDNAINKDYTNTEKVDTVTVKEKNPLKKAKVVVKTLLKK